MKQVRVAVGTQNPCKITAVKDAFSATFPPEEYEIITLPYSIPSGVPDQPFGDSETKQGAINRARGAYSEALNNSDHPADFGVGLEGGIEIIKNDAGGDDLWCMAFMCIIGTTSELCTSCKHPQSTFEFVQPLQGNQDHNKEIVGIAKTAAFPLPIEISRLVMEEKQELGHADDQVFNRVNGKQGDGTVGMLTKSLVSRAEYYTHALYLALIPFVWPEHYV